MRGLEVVLKVNLRLETRFSERIINRCEILGHVGGRLRFRLR